MAIPPIGKSPAAALRAGRGGLGGGRLAPAWGAEVVSSNIVGYQRMALDKGYNMIGIQFTEVDANATAKDLMTAPQLASTMAGFDEDGHFATEMMVWENNDYTTYGWSGTSGTDVLEDDSFNNQWLNVDLEKVEDVEATPYTAVWIKAGEANGSVTVSGQVPTGDVTVPLSAGYNMVANPFPMTVPVTTFGTLSAGMAGFDEDGHFATELMVWKDGDYTTYGWSGSSGTEVLEDASFDNKWLNVDLEETDDVVDFGHGVWIKAGSAGSITFKAP